MNNKIVYDVAYALVLIVVTAAAFLSDISALSLVAYCLVWAAIIAAAATLAFSGVVAIYDNANLETHCREIVSIDLSPSMDTLKVMLLASAIIWNGWYVTAGIYLLMELNAFLMLCAARYVISKADAGMKV